MRGLHIRFIKNRFSCLIGNPKSHQNLLKVLVATSCLVTLILYFTQPVVAVGSTTPVLDVIGDHTADENSLLSFSLSANDPDDDTLVFSASGLPPGSSLNSSTGLFRWTPAYNQSGNYLTQFVVSDGEHIDYEYITITVNNKNRAPLFSIISETSINESEKLQMNLTVSDQDGDLLVFSKDVSFGKIRNNSFTWTPDYGDQGEHSIVFSVSDGYSTVKQNAVINVSNVNREPILYSIGDRTANLNESVTVQLNAFDPDEDDVLNYYNISTLPEGSSFDPNTGLFQWPDPDELGSFMLTFGVSDGMSSSTSTAKIVIGESNSPPVIDSVDTQFVDENSELIFEVSAFDKQNDTLRYSYPDGIPENAVITMKNSSYHFQWTPSYEDSGFYKVLFEFSDGIYSSYEVVDIIVSDVNRAPLIDPVTDSSVSETSVLYINLTANDPDNDELVFSTNSSLGTVRGNTFICKPGYTDAGIYDILFKVSDGTLTNSTTATITVTDTNMPPKLNSISPKKVVKNETLEFYLSAYDEDEGDTLTYTGLDMPSGAHLDSSTALFSWTPSLNQTGKYSVGFHVNDGSFDDYETIWINVTEPSSGDVSSSSSGSGGGGGGSMSTGESYENIEFKDYSLKYVMKDRATIFEFDEPANNIVSISFVSGLNGGQTKAVVEILKDTSVLVDASPSGNVYKNLNIWVGDSKFPSDMINDIVIKFKVEKAWILSRDIHPESVELYRYSNGEWNSLKTSMTGEDSEYFYYESKAPGFSPFAIVVPDLTVPSMVEENSDSNVTQMSVADENPIPVEKADMPRNNSNNKSLLILLLMGIIAVLGFAGIKYRSYYEKLYLKIGNPDGKRYRRLKK